MTCVSSRYGFKYQVQCFKHSTIRCASDLFNHLQNTPSTTTQLNLFRLLQEYYIHCDQMHTTLEQLKLYKQSSNKMQSTEIFSSVCFSFCPTPAMLLLYAVVFFRFSLCETVLRLKSGYNSERQQLAAVQCHYMCSTLKVHAQCAHTEYVFFGTLV